MIPALASGPSAWQAAPGDPVLATRLVEKAGSPVWPAAGGWIEWLGHLGRYLLERVLTLFERAFGALPPGVARWIFWGVAAAAAALLAYLLYRAVSGWSRRVRPRSSAASGAQIVEVPAAAAAWGVAEWRAELERRLAAGRTAEALEAAWWWLARSVAGMAVEVWWTAGDLVRRSGRRDLLPGLAALDRLAYGPSRPGPAEVAALVGRLEEVLS